MQNWSGNQQWTPQQVSFPKTEEEILTLVRYAHEKGLHIRTMGTRHSFTALNNTDAVQVSLDNWQGIVAVDPEKKEVTVKAGTKLHLLGRQLAEVGLAMENMGDIDQQSIAGAISTGTHGTGTRFGNISTQVIGITFINGQGEKVFCSEQEQPDLFKCLQVSLGAFGIITEIRLRCVPTYRLKLEKRKENLAEVLANIDHYNQANRNFEFYWLPYTQTTQTKFTNESEEVADQANLWTYINDVWIENYVFMGLCELARLVPQLNRSVSRFSAQFLGESTKVSDSHLVYATPRYVRFNEMEYNVPLSAYQEVIKEVMQVVNSGRYAIHFPIENRFVKGDNIWLSPAYGRDSAYIACHVYKGKEHKAYFHALEGVFKAYDGRPHWGKLHFRDAASLARTYPKWKAFKTLRAAHDPNGLFLNPYLRQLFAL